MRTCPQMQRQGPGVPWEEQGQMRWDAPLALESLFWGRRLF